MPQRGVQQGQDWSTVSFSNRPQSAASSSHQKQQGLKDAQRTGGQIETSTKFGGGKNGGLTAAAAEAHRLDNDTGEGSHAKVPTELKLALQKARNAKGISQKQLATQLNMQPQVVNEYESGKAIPNNAIIAKFEKALGCKLPRVAKVKKSAE
jgi:putative transcription factor